MKMIESLKRNSTEKINARRQKRTDKLVLSDIKNFAREKRIGAVVAL
jgi:hypothetical protein